MTYQDFNHIYYKFTGNEKGIRPTDSIQTSGQELKEFVEFALKVKFLAADNDQSKLEF